VSAGVGSQGGHRASLRDGVAVLRHLEKRLQELRWCDRVDTMARPGLAFMILALKDSTPPGDLREQFYQARKKLGDEAKNLPARALGPFINEAVIEATVQRARPVILTALAAVLAFIPLTHSVFWGSMAYTLIGGTAVGTIPILLFLPALYAVWFRIKAHDLSEERKGSEALNELAVTPAQ
jgi:multidrug efflux pump subunit AcrB